MKEDNSIINACLPNLGHLSTSFVNPIRYGHGKENEAVLQISMMGEIFVLALNHKFYKSQYCMTIPGFISTQLPGRQQLLTHIHEIIVKEDTSVKATVETMMGKEMIVYKAGGAFKYGLAGMKNYLSLHVMPMYASLTLYSKYKTLLTKANFQKGCINFNNEEELPLPIVRKLIIDCSAIDLRAIKEAYIKSKSKKP
jgi:hypothetical protein